MTMFVDAIIKVAVTKKRKIEAKDLLPCPETLKNNVVKMGAEIREKLVTLFDKIRYINCTTDHWQEDQTKQNFMTITVHYTDPEELSVKSRVIGTFGVEDKTSKTTIKHFDEKLNQLKMRHKVRLVITDSCPSMPKAFGNDSWIACSAHNLALLQKWAFNQQESKEKPDPIPLISDLLEAAKTLVTYVKQSGINAQFRTRLGQSISVRWDSTLDMLESVQINLSSLDEIPAVAEYMSKINRGLMQEIITLMTKFRAIRTSLCADQRATFHSVALAYTLIKKHIVIEPADSGPIQILKMRFKKFLTSKFVLSPYHLIATFLVPKYRHNDLGDKVLKEKADNCLDALLEEETESDPEEAKEDNNQIINSDPTDNLFSAFAQKPLDGRDKMSELRRYQRLEFTACDLSSCPIKFWSVNSVQFPKLSAIAFWLLSAPATSCSSERNFSAAGLIYDHRPRLKAETVDDDLLLKSNYDLV